MSERVHQADKHQHADTQESQPSLPPPVRLSPPSSRVHVSLDLDLAASGDRIFFFFLGGGMRAWIPGEAFMTGRLSPRSKNTQQRPLPSTPTPTPTAAAQRQAAGVVAFVRRRGSDGTSACRCHLHDARSTSTRAVLLPATSRQTGSEVAEISEGAPTTLNWDFPPPPAALGVPSIFQQDFETATQNKRVSGRSADTGSTLTKS